MFVLIKETRSHDGHTILVSLAGYSCNELLLNDKAAKNNAIYEEKLRNFIPYQQRSEQYDLNKPVLKISEFQDANPQLDIPTMVSCYQQIYADWLSQKLNVIGRPENEPTFDFFSVHQVKEITQ